MKVSGNLTVKKKLAPPGVLGPSLPVAAGLPAQTMAGESRGGTTFLLCVLMSFQGACVYQPEFLGRSEGRQPPRIRLSCYASSTIGTTYTDPNHLGLHGYKSRGSEKGGIVYTCKAGHIDIPHVRKAADWTAYFAEKTLQHLRKGKNEFTFKLYEPSIYFVRVTYPQNWERLPDAEKEQIMREISVRLAQYFAYIGCTWHEILTWFGYRPVLFYPEFPSAFSWEDTFSNLLGTHIAGMALRDAKREYDEAMTVAIYRELQKLGVQPRHTAIQAAEEVRGKWFSGGFLFLVNMKGRNFDIGVDDGFVTPWLVPSLAECRGAQAESYPVPNLYFLADYGFSLKLEIEPRELERGKVLKIIYPDSVRRGNRIEPAIHFAAIMDYIRRDAEKIYGRDILIDRTGPLTESQSDVQQSHNAPLSPTHADTDMLKSPVVSKAGHNR